MYSWTSSLILFGSLLSQLRLAQSQHVREGKGEHSIPRYLNVDSSCAFTPKQLTMIYARTYEVVEATLQALNSSDQSLLEFFFNPATKGLVQAGFERLERWLTHPENFSVTLSCQKSDQDIACTNPASWAVFVKDKANKGPPGIIPEKNSIVLCPTFFFLSRTQTNPCDRTELELYPSTPEGTSHAAQDQVLLHELFHIPYVIGPGIEQVIDIATTTAECHTLRRPKSFSTTFTGVPRWQRNPIYNAHSYGVLAKWAWMQKQQQKFCPEAYPLWNILQESSPSDRVELRRLLGENQTTDIVQSDIVNGVIVLSVQEQFDLRVLNASGKVAYEAINMNDSIFVADADPFFSPVTVSWSPPTSSNAVPSAAPSFPCC